MPKKKANKWLNAKSLTVINFSLILISTLLMLNLFDISITPIGHAIQDSIDTEDAICFASYQDQKSQINLDLCCQEAKKQLRCENQKQTFQNIETDILCQTGESTISYSLTNKAQRYCEANY